MNYASGQAVIGNPALNAVERRPGLRVSGVNGDDVRRAVRLSLLFEDLPAGIRAKIMLDQIATSMDPADPELNILKRSFASLKDREPCEWAANEGIRADVLWLAVQGQRDLPECMSDYVAAWMQAEGKSRSRAVVLAFDPNLDCSLRRDRVLNAMSRIEKAADTAVFVDFGTTPTTVWRTRIKRIANGALPLD
jgi:hypothetical protein